MPSEMSLLKAAILFDFARIAVRDWATVSAMPPSTYIEPSFQHLRTRIARGFVCFKYVGGYIQHW